MKDLTTNEEDIKTALESSTFLKFNDDKTKITRVEPLPEDYSNVNALVVVVSSTLFCLWLLLFFLLVFVVLLVFSLMIY